jgi:hypothetical protein
MRRLALLCLLALACGASEHDWSAEEIGNAEYVFTALHADRRASQIENLGEAGFDDRKEEEASLEFREKALQSARSVRDEVLDKLHPELRGHFRTEFERSQALFLEARREGRPSLENQAIALRNDFGDWWVRHGNQVKLPRLE